MDFPGTAQALIGHARREGPQPLSAHVIAAGFEPTSVW